MTLDQVEELLNTAQKEGCLTAEQLEYIGITLTAVERLKDYLSRGKHLESGFRFMRRPLSDDGYKRRAGGISQE